MGASVGDIVPAHLYACVGVVVGAHVGVHVSNVLPIAFRHLDDLGTDIDELAATLLLSPTAALANRERDLVRATPARWMELRRE